MGADDDYNAYEERLNMAMQMIDRLPERQAKAVRLRHFDGEETASIANKMNISEGNVYTLLSRAYSSLKQMITEYENR